MHSSVKICFTIYFSFNQMIAMHCRRHSYLGSATLHKLQQRHLCRSILHRNTIRCKVYIRFSSFKCAGSISLPKVGIQYFFGKRKWFANRFAGSFNAATEMGVHFFDHVNVEGHSVNLNPAGWQAGYTITQFDICFQVLLKK